MLNTFNKTLTATALTILVSLPFGAQATEANINSSPAAKGSIKEILADIQSDPRGADGEIIKTIKALPFGAQDTTVANCWYCTSAGCFPIC